ncbi:MAG: hypothetical protein ABIC68_01250 [Candidatus Omnitrophota bacterium]
MNRLKFFSCLCMGFLALCFFPLENAMAGAVHGFFEFDYGGKIKESQTKHDAYNLFEQRLQLKASYDPAVKFLSDLSTRFYFKGDFLVDEYFAGKTDFELREANLSLTPYTWLDVKVGQQILTWGTGDYLFINDVFPKDYVSFYIGRDDEYLKEPSDALKCSLYHELANLNLVIIPVFTPNTMPDGQRLSFFDPLEGGIVGTSSDRYLISPYNDFQDVEIAARLYRNFDSYETALYFFHGYYNIAYGYENEAAHQLFYPRLNVGGGSIRGPAFGGIMNIEAGLYDSLQDRKGDDRLVTNSSFRVMAGYDKDLGHDFKLGLQYYFEEMLDYNNYKNSLLPADFVQKEQKHFLTVRLTKLMMLQTLKLSLFAFFSPVDLDFYIRPIIEYNATDQWKVVVGADFFGGSDEQTDFGSMRQNSNVYVRLRYNF